MVDRSRTGIAGLDKSSFLATEQSSSKESLLTGTWQPDGTADTLSERLFPKDAAKRHQQRANGYDLVPDPAANVYAGVDLSSMADDAMSGHQPTNSSPSKVEIVELLALSSPASLL